MSDNASACLHAPITVDFDYTRSYGPVLGTFVAALAEERILGARLADGRIVCPPCEYDPQTLEPVTDLIDVGTRGSVETWSWVADPVQGQPFDRPFAYALIRLDGTDEPLLHVVDADHEEMRSGMRVQARWASENVGSIADIACFEPTSEVPDRAAGQTADSLADLAGVRKPALPTPLTGFTSPIHLHYDYAASPEESKFFRGLARGRILGQRCPVCLKVYVPPRGACPVDGVPTTDEVEVAHTGTVTTFCIVNVPFLGQKIEPPYVSAYVLLDGADIALQHIVLDIPAAEVRMGMRVEAVWRPEQEWSTTIENISHFRPLDEPDADFESYRQHL